MLKVVDLTKFGQADMASSVMPRDRTFLIVYAFM